MPSPLPSLVTPLRARTCALPRNITIDADLSRFTWRLKSAAWPGLAPCRRTVALGSRMPRTSLSAPAFKRPVSTPRATEATAVRAAMKVSFAFASNTTREFSPMLISPRFLTLTTTLASASVCIASSVCNARPTSAPLHASSLPARIWTVRWILAMLPSKSGNVVVGVRANPRCSIGALTLPAIPALARSSLGAVPPGRASRTTPQITPAAKAIARISRPNSSDFCRLPAKNSAAVP